MNAADAKPADDVNGRMFSTYLPSDKDGSNIFSDEISEVRRKVRGEIGAAISSTSGPLIDQD